MMLEFRERRKRPETTHIIVHHSASRDVPASEIHRWHLERGWWGIGYHRVIRTDGSVEQGRDINDQGAHASGWNDKSVGIVLTGNFEEHAPSDEQIVALGRELEALCARYSLSSDKVISHQETGAATLCPGEYLQEQMDDIRAALFEDTETFQRQTQWAFQVQSSYMVQDLYRHYVVGVAAGTPEAAETALRGKLAGDPHQEVIRRMPQFDVFRGER